MAPSGNPDDGEVDPAAITVEGWKERLEGAMGKPGNILRLISSPMSTLKHSPMHI
jgi:hypothetical protein